MKSKELTDEEAQRLRDYIFSAEELAVVHKFKDRLDVNLGPYFQIFFNACVGNGYF